MTGKLLYILGVKISQTTLEKDLFHHPNYPSLLSVSDVIAGYGVENISIKTTIARLRDLPLPCIALVKNNHDDTEQYAVIKSLNENGISYFEPEKRQWVETSSIDFEKRWPTGIVLLADAEGAKGEKDFLKNVTEEKRISIARFTAFLSLPFLALVTSVWAFMLYGAAAAIPFVFLLLTLLGCLMVGLLIWYELDQYNPVLQQICSANKKINCAVVLNSKASKIAGVSWSAIGFIYFVGGLITLLIFGLFNPVALNILTWLNTLAVPYVFFSVYYQWRIAKQWCVLCLSVQVLLVLQLFTTLFAGWHTIAPVSDIVRINNIVSVSLAFILAFIIVNLLLPGYRSAKKSRQSMADLQRLKHNPQIFETLLAKQKSITQSSEGLGIFLGNPSAKYKIVKVCNPYCTPCAKAHTPIEELLHNNHDVQVQIIFTATNKEGDKSGLPVKHLLAIAEKGTETKQALDDWYLAEKKDYDFFASKYPMNGELKRQGEKIDAMEAWCNKTEIIFTPTFFINGKQLPEIYTVNDLKYFF